MFGQSDNSAFDTLDHDKHRMRREPWNPYFSKQSVSRLQPLLIQTAVNKLCDRLAEHQAAGKPVIMTHAYACLTVDVISEYSFPIGYRLLDRPEFDSKNYQAWMALSKISHTLKQFGWLYPLLSSMPLWVTKFTSPETYLILSQTELLYQQTLAIQAQKGRSEYKELTARSSMLAAFLDSDLPEPEKTAHRIAGEAQIAIGAGTLTSSHALKHATYHLLANPPILERLMGDLQKAIPDPESPPNLRELEQIPYLVAILYETLRIFHGVSHRLQRIFPDHSIQYNEWVIPAGTPVGMTSVHTHNDPNIFPEPYTFKPERWLPLPTEGQRLQKYLMAFGKGSRQCVGMELGKAEVLTTLANVFRRFGRVMRLYEITREKDIDLVYDVFNPMASRQSNGLMVLFEKPLDPA
jgi:cytochrome P450